MEARISRLGLILPCPEQAQPLTIPGLRLFPKLRQRCENEGKGHRDPETQPVSKATLEQSQVLLLPPKSLCNYVFRFKEKKKIIIKLCSFPRRCGKTLRQQQLLWAVIP